MGKSMKFEFTLSNTKRKKEVAPFAGAWIEISEEKGRRLIEVVAPFAGAWIEIDIYRC